jgi:lipid A ethanolaminephosphotransferase
MTPSEPTTGHPILGHLRLSPFALTLLAGIFMTALHNNTFWIRLYAVFAGHPVSLVLFGLAIFGVQMFLITLFSPRWLLRPMLAFLLILGGVTSFYQDTLGTTIDREMIQNAMTTTVTESKHLITLPFALHVLFLGLLPALFVIFVPLRRAPMMRSVFMWLLSAALYLGLFAACILIDGKNLMGAGREHQEITSAIQPLMPVRAMYRYAQMMLKKPTVVAPLGRDAKPGPHLAAADKPVLILIWAGETARGQNWGMNGYARDTSPELAKRGVLNYTDVTSCGTATATSLPCEFSHLTRKEYSFDGGISNENLLDVLSHAGFDVEWWDNNTGDKDIAKRQSRHMMTERATEEYCGRGECIDGIFLDLIREKAATITKNTVLVLHQIGSHGPSYYLRFPPDFAKFGPICETPEVAQCSSELLTNAYDATLLYTDWVMAQSVDILNASDRITPMMFYVSDHGESLGENGLYLHGAPYFMAPRQQTWVPMVMWFADRYAQKMGVDTACMRAKTNEPAAQDNMFATILGLADVQTSVRNPALDLSEGCRK